MRNIVLDTGAVIALLRPSDSLHAVAEQAFASLSATDRLHTTWPVVTECAFILRDADAAFWSWLAAAAVSVADFTLAEALQMRVWARR